MRKYFGTDGVRGRANGVITPELALKVGQAAGVVFQRGDHRHRVVIGKDTRLSGYMIETALVAGFTSVGMDVLLLGPMPTPAVAMLTRSMRADLGVMISASPNPFEDTGGNQSFALAMLDADGNGWVLSSLHARSGTRVYAKAIRGGLAETTLSEEENAALMQAAA